MARSTKSGAQPLALEMLTADHRKVEQMFQQYEQEKEGDEETRRQLAEKICNEVTVHAQIEEELFYPWVREKLDEADLIEEALVEHQSAKALIAQLQGGEVDETYDAKVKVLGEYIKHHAREEENEIFPEVRDNQEELDELGQELAARKMELKEELGMEADEDDAMASQGSRQGKGRSSGNSQRATR